MNGAGRGTLAPGDPHHFQLSRRYAFSNADVIVIVGTPFDFRMGYGKRLSPDATVVQIDLDYRTVGKNRDIDLGIVGDAGLVLKSVTEAASGRLNGGASKRKEWLDELRAAEQTALDRRLPQLRSDASPIHPYRLVSEINDFLTEDSVYIGDGGDIVTFSGQVVQPKSTGPLDGPGPLGTLGVGVPFAPTAKQRGPTRRSSPSSATAPRPHRLGLRDTGPLRPPLRRHRRQQLLDNQIRYGQAAKYGKERERVGNTLGDVPYDQFARSRAATARRYATPPTSAPRCAGPASPASRR
ncbi:Acetolactate synthase OS=Streptomyces tendae OX=1932 GN=GUR47_01740 PE=3 SV=1 [Streptomyces tendae]